MSRAEPMKTQWSEEYDLATLATRGARRWDGRPNAVRHQQPAAPGRRRPCSGSRALVSRWDRDPLRDHRCRASLRARAWAHHERALVDVARRSARGFLRVRLDRPDPPPGGRDDGRLVPRGASDRVHSDRPFRPARRHRATSEHTPPSGGPAHHSWGRYGPEVLNLQRGSNLIASLSASRFRSLPNVRFAVDRYFYGSLYTL